MTKKTKKINRIYTKNIPERLKKANNWVGWKYEDTEDEDETKVPYTPTTGQRAKQNDPQTWTDFNSLLENPQYQLGFEFSTSPFAGIDLDKCRNPETGDIDSEAEEIINELNSYTEVSPSGTGLHVIVEGEFTETGNKTFNVEFGELEIYDKNRYFTVTGHILDSEPKSIKQRQEKLDQLHDKYFGDKEKEKVDFEDREGNDLPNKEVLKAAKNANDELFSILWNGKTKDYKKFARERGWDASLSGADYHLCRKLLFYTGGDPEQTEELFGKSGLVREKWKREDYRERTIIHALDNQEEFYNAPQKQKGSPAWQAVNAAYAKGNKRRARVQASDAIQDEWDFVTIPEGDQFLVYEPKQGFYTDYGEELIENRLQSKISNDVSTYEVREIKAHIKRGNYVREENFGPDNKDLICVKNGVLNLRTGELSEHSKDYQFRRQIPVKYDPEASSEKLEEFLQKTLPDEQTIKVIEEIAGHCLYRNYFLQKAFMLVGSGSNGKGVLLDLIENMVGDKNQASTSLQALSGGSRFQTQFLYKKFANIAGDIAGDQLKDVGLFKKLTGQDFLAAEVKGSNRQIRFRNYASMIFSTNNLPQSPDDTDAFHRRWILIDFPHKFVDNPSKNDDKEKKKDPNLRDKLNAEKVKSATLNRALNGIQRLLQNKKFSYNPSTSEARKMWNRKANPIKVFAREKLESMEKGWEAKKEVYQAYKEYCEENEVQDNKVKKQGAFSRELKKHIKWESSRPKDPETGKRVRAYEGLQLKPDYPEKPPF